MTGHAPPTRQYTLAGDHALNVVWGCLRSHQDHLAVSLSQTQGCFVIKGNDSDGRTRRSWKPGGYFLGVLGIVHTAVQ